MTLIYTCLECGKTCDPDIEGSGITTTYICTTCGGECDESETAPQFKVPEHITVRPVTVRPMDENIGYRRDMIEAGRGHLLK